MFSNQFNNTEHVLEKTKSALKNMLITNMNKWNSYFE